MGYIPIELNEGLVALYKIKQQSSINNIAAPNEFNWATIYQISWYGIDHVAVGQSVLYKGTEVVCKLAFAHESYPIIEEAKLVTITEINNNSEPLP